MNETLKYWRLSDDPFFIAKAPWFFPGKPQNQLTATLTSKVGDLNRCVIVESQRLCGMTTLFTQLRQSRGFGPIAVQTLYSTAHGRSDLRSTLMQFEISLEKPTIVELQRWIQASSQTGIHTVWIADGVDESTIVMLNQLLPCEGLTAVVGVNSKDLSRVRHAMNSRKEVLTLRSFDIEDTTAFIQRSLERVGGSNQIVSREAIDRIHKRSEGRVGWVASITTEALNHAAIELRNQVTASVVDRIADESFRDVIPMARCA